MVTVLPPEFRSTNQRTSEVPGTWVDSFFAPFSCFCERITVLAENTGGYQQTEGPNRASQLIWKATFCDHILLDIDIPGAMFSEPFRTF